MKTVKIYKGGSIDDHQVEDVQIIISEELTYPKAVKEETSREWMEKCEQMRDDQAQKLYQALRDTLPQGVFNQLTSYMLSDCAGVLRVGVKE